MMVGQVINALHNFPSKDHSMEETSSDDDGSLKEIDDDMTLGHYQEVALNETTTTLKRAPSKRGAKPKKGRSSPFN